MSDLTSSSPSVLIFMDGRDQSNFLIRKVALNFGEHVLRGRPLGRFQVLGKTQPGKNARLIMSTAEHPHKDLSQLTYDALGL